MSIEVSFRCVVLCKARRVRESSKGSSTRSSEMEDIERKYYCTTVDTPYIIYYFLLVQGFSKSDSVAIPDRSDTRSHLYDENVNFRFNFLDLKVRYNVLEGKRVRCIGALEKTKSDMLIKMIKVYISTWNKSFAVRTKDLCTTLGHHL